MKWFRILRWKLSLSFSSRAEYETARAAPLRSGLRRYHLSDTSKLSGITYPQFELNKLIVPSALSHLEALRRLLVEAQGP